MDDGQIDTHHERMMACLGKIKAMDFEANPEEMKSVAPGKLWILEEIGRHRQKDDPLCRSGTGQGTHRQEDSD
jgi:hypothetical protein